MGMIDSHISKIIQMRHHLNYHYISLPDHFQHASEQLLMLTIMLNMFCASTTMCEHKQKRPFIFSF